MSLFTSNCVDGNNNFFTNFYCVLVGRLKCELLFVGTATQLVILPPHIPLIVGQGGGMLLLRRSLSVKWTRHF